MGNANKKGLVKSKKQGESGSQKGVSRASSKSASTRMRRAGIKL